MVPATSRLFSCYWHIFIELQKKSSFFKGDFETIDKTCKVSAVLA